MITNYLLSLTSNNITDIDTNRKMCTIVVGQLKASQDS